MHGGSTRVAGEDGGQSLRSSRLALRLALRSPARARVGSAPNATPAPSAAPPGGKPVHDARRTSAVVRLLFLNE